MKKKIADICIKYRYDLKTYKCYLSDMGCRCYEIEAIKNGKSVFISDGYWDDNKEGILNDFENAIIEAALTIDKTTL